MFGCEVEEDGDMATTFPGRLGHASRAGVSDHRNMTSAHHGREERPGCALRFEGHEAGGSGQVKRDQRDMWLSPVTCN